MEDVLSISFSLSRLGLLPVNLAERWIFDQILEVDQTVVLYLMFFFPSVHVFISKLFFSSADLMSLKTNLATASRSPATMGRKGPAALFLS